MTDNSSSIVTPEVVEFATVGVSFCSLLQEVDKIDKASFLDKILKILPLLYIKGMLLSDTLPEDYSEEEDFFLPESVSEEEYTLIARSLESLLGREDLFLEVLSEDMDYSDTPLTARVSECLADIYQPVGNLLGILRAENFVALPLAVYQTRMLFAEYWGDRVLAVLRALHKITYASNLSEEEGLENLDEDDFEAQIDKMFD